VTFQQRATTIEQGYADDRSQSEWSPSTTSPQGFIFVTGQVVAKCQPALPVQDSPASLLSAYLSSSASVFIEGGDGSGTVMQEFFLNREHPVGEPQRPTTIPSRREKYARLIALIESWLADDSGYDEAVWPRLKARIEESRTSARKRFSD